MRLAAIFAAAAALLAIALPAQADEVVLKYATLNPPQSAVTREWTVPWVDKVNEAGKGALKIEIFPGEALANNLNVYDRVLADVAQIAWGIPVYFTGKFNLTNVTGLPFLGGNAEAQSTAFWRLYAKGAFGSEYSEIQPLIMIGLPQSGIHMASKPMKTLDDFKGTKFRTGSKIAGDIILALGATPISIQVGEMTQSLQRGLVEGVIMPWTAFNPFRLDEVTHYHVDVPFGGGPIFVFMAKKRYDALPAAAKKAIDDHSGEATSRDFGKWWDGEEKKTRDRVSAMQGHTVVSLPKDEYDRWAGRVQTVLDEWGKSMQGGAAVIAQYKQEIANVEARR
jgi:TRAP-type C4-dicarboxylate transport system substrate-binding protein